MKPKILIFIIILISIISFSSFKGLQNHELKQNKVETEQKGTIGVYIKNTGGEYESSSEIPLKDSGYEFAKAVCKDDVVAEWNSDNWSLQVSNVSNFKCNLYFDIALCPNGATACKQIIANIDTIDERTDFSAVMTAETTNTVYIAEDDDGTSYYFAGAPTDNYVKFAGYYWRIIRINGDGTIRLIYAGTTAIANGTSSTKTQISKKAFNTSYTDNMYMGFMYTEGEIHGLSTKSTILNALETFYSENLLNYDSYIDQSSGFCNDRQPSTSPSKINGKGGTGTTETYYPAYIRLVIANKPTFNCADTSDLFTKTSGLKGNKSLTYPIGLITADEIVFAGSSYLSSNTSYYLFTGQEYWTMSPDWFGTNGSAYIFRVNTSGGLDTTIGNQQLGVRPVINLKADTLFTGTGTSTDPYIVS